MSMEINPMEKLSVPGGISSCNQSPQAVNLLLATKHQPLEPTFHHLPQIGHEPLSQKYMRRLRTNPVQPL